VRPHRGSPHNRVANPAFQPPGRPLETARLRGEPIGPAHADALAELLADPRVGATLGGVCTRAEADAMLERQALQWHEHGYGLRAWFERASGRFVARGGLQHTVVGGAEEVEVGWAVVAERWGRGYATELGAASIEVAFGELGLDDVVAFTLPDNLRSRRVMDKLGFAFEREVEHAGLPHVLYRLRARAT
jgi:RimJ/RimL family protein N-acetyltransferase